MTPGSILPMREKLARTRLMPLPMPTYDRCADSVSIGFIRVESLWVFLETYRLHSKRSKQNFLFCS